MTSAAARFLRRRLHALVRRPINRLAFYQLHQTNIYGAGHQ